MFWNAKSNICLALLHKWIIEFRVSMILGHIRGIISKVLLIYFKCVHGQLRVLSWLIIRSNAAFSRTFISCGLNQLYLFSIAQLLLTIFGSQYFLNLRQIKLNTFDSLACLKTSSCRWNPPARDGWGLVAKIAVDVNFTFIELMNV